MTAPSFDNYATIPSPDPDRLAHLDPTTRAQLEHIEKLAKMMDSQFALPGTQIRLGIDTLIGLIPGIGDTLSLGIAGYIVAHSAKMGVKKRTLTKMGYNIFVDWLIGLVPLIGDIFDVGWRGNNRNAALLRRSLEVEPRDVTPRPSV